MGGMAISAGPAHTAERVAALEARVAQLEARLSQLSMYVLATDGQTQTQLDFEGHRHSSVDDWILGPRLR